MFRYDVQQNQWLIAALAGGVALLATFVLAYIALWRQEPDETPAGQVGAAGQKPSRWLLAWAPWVLLVIYLGTLVWGLAYVLMQAYRPPNW